MKGGSGSKKEHSFPLLLLAPFAPTALRCLPIKALLRSKPPKITCSFCSDCSKKGEASLSRITLYADGLCEPTNPNGYACYGWLAIQNGERLSEGCGYIGRGKGMTNIQKE